MSTITKERVAGIANGEKCYTHDDVVELARIALASLEAEAVAWLWSNRKHPSEVTLVRPEDDDKAEAAQWSGWSYKALYTAPPAPVENTGLQRKAAVHDALCEKYSVKSLADFVDWQRNHIAGLEAAPPAPVGKGETAVMPDYPGYTMTQRECFQAGKKAGLAEAGNSPVIPDGWVLVPVEPTEDMIVNGFESEPDESFSDEKEWEVYDAMSGCQQAAHRAKLCWAAMIASAPKV
ncbi:hypothetical protein [Enterobacter roggenkampii]|uniref:hypothetical protein n=1 Tax=Enterobacter roggenkampii TaxID=1812935 RepID=UPI001CA84153|nr:hypothetical protein [Enterobacter roggenkampii]